MKGREERQCRAYFLFNEELLIPKDHPLRGIKRRVEEELARMQPCFREAYAGVGRPSIPPEQLIKATLLQALYSIRSERRLCEEIGYSILYRWFLNLPLDEPMWDHSTFSKNRQRFAEHGLMRRFFEGSVAQAIQEEAASQEHFSMDGTLIEAWASMKSVRPKGEEGDGDQAGWPGDSNGWVDWRGEKRSNATHQSRTDPEARLARKGPGQETKLAHSLQVLMENRNGLVMGIAVAEANGEAEREEGKGLLKRARQRYWLRPKTAGADKGFDDGEFLEELERELGVVPHVATREGPMVSEDAAGLARRRARRRQKTKGYQLSQKCRKRVEEIFAWLKTIGGLRRTRFIGRWKTQLYAYAAAAVYNFLRLTRLVSA